MNSINASGNVDVPIDRSSGGRFHQIDLEVVPISPIEMRKLGNTPWPANGKPFRSHWIIDGKNDENCIETNPG